MGKSMADANQLKRIEPIDYGEDDPFAELTRIMGFDPRVPVRPTAANEPRQAAVQPAPPVAQAMPVHDEVDFDIDLERELLGGLSLDDEPQALVAPSSWRATAPQPAADLEVEFDEAFAMDVGDLELDLDMVEAANDDLAFEAARAAAPVSAQVMEDQPMAADRRNDEYARIPPRDEALKAAPVAPAAEEDPDFGFDLAMAQVDMDFDASPAVAADAVDEARAVDQELDLALFDEDAFEEALELEPEMFAAPAPEPAAAPAAHTPVFQATARAPLFQAPVARQAAVEPVQPASAAVAEHETSLEDELAALLASPIAPAELPGSYEVEPLPGSAAAEARAGEVLAGPQAEDRFEDDIADFEAELADWQPGDAVPMDHDDDYADAAGPVEAYAVDAEDAYYAEEATADAAYYDDQPTEAAYEGAGGHDAEAGEVYADEAYAEEAQPVAADEPAAARADEVAIDPFAALRAMAEAGRGSPAPFHAGYRSLATPVANTAYAGGRSSYQYAAPAAVAAPAATASYAAYEPEAPAASYAAAAQIPAYEQHEPAGFEQEQSVAYEADAVEDYAPVSFADSDVPDIETVDVPETGYAVADDLDLPELAFAVDDAPLSGYDDFERDLAAAYAEPEALDEMPAAETPDLSAYGEEAYDARPIDLGTAALSTAGAAGWSHAAEDRRLADFDAEFDAATNAAFADLGDFDDDLAEPAAAPLPIEERRSEGTRRGMLIAAIVGGVAIIGGIGAFALSSGGGGSDVPVLVRADESPVKVRPENPGGTVVPNQDNKVYQTVTGGVSAPEQEKLITSSEEPVDVAAEPIEGALPLNEDDVAADPTGKIEDRVAPETDAAAAASETAEEVAAVAPRKVRTMVVRPDGSLVPREEPAAEAETAIAEPQPGAEASAMQPAAAAEDTAPAAQAPAADAAPVEKAPAAKAAGSTKTAEAKVETPKAVEKTRTASIPDAGPLAPSRPADQPVDVVGEVKPEQVAAAGATAAAGAWSVQIASQPSEEAAKSTYQDLSRRYAGVIGGKGVTIVKAEISGKGTFYRVRVPAGSRNDAIALCEKYKAAGGNCFVSK